MKEPCYVAYKSGKNSSLPSVAWNVAVVSPKRTTCALSFPKKKKRKKEVPQPLLSRLYDNSRRHWLSAPFLFSNDKAQKSEPKQTTTNLVFHPLPENTNAYQFMQVENRSGHQPMSPANSQILKPIQI